VRRLVVALAAVAVMATTMVVGPSTTMGVGPLTTEVGPASASAQQTVGGPTYCGPWQQAWYISYSRWWYYWYWRWCYNPSLPPDVTVGGGWYIDYAGWHWYLPAPPWQGPGWQYNGPPPY
jgi:hypothetical protein